MSGRSRSRTKTKLADAANPVGWDEGEERDGRRVAQSRTLVHQRLSRLLVELLEGVLSRLLHVAPLAPATDTFGRVERLSPTGLLRLAAQVDDLGQGRRVHAKQVIAGIQIRVTIGCGGDEAVEVVGNLKVGDGCG